MLGTELVRRAPRLGTFTARLTEDVKTWAAPVLALTPAAIWFYSKRFRR